MADIVPITTGALSAGYLGPSRTKLFWDSTDATNPNPLDRTKPIDPARFRYRAAYFTGVIGGNDWSQPRGVVACAWQANTVTDTKGAVNVGAGVRVQGSAAGADGWLHILYGGSFQTNQATEITPPDKGATGYLPEGMIFLNHKSATPNTLTYAKRRSIAGLRFQVYPIATTGAASDRWKATTGTAGERCPGIVAVAWQNNAAGSVAAERVAATLDAAGDVVLQAATAGVVTGWLWVWRTNA